jgi:hypothetical protein
MPSDDANQVEHWKSVYASKSDAEIRVEMASWKQTAPGWIAADLILQQRARERDSTKPLLTSLNEQVTMIAGRMTVIEQETRQPPYKTWTFWLAVIALLVSMASLLRDFWDFKLAN